MKIFLVIIGFISLILGIIGTFLPIIPTMPFLFVAYFCFKNGSPRFRKWYLQSIFHKKYQQGLKIYNSIPLRYKILYVITIILLFIIALILFVNFYTIIISFIKSIIQHFIN